MLLLDAVLFHIYINNQKFQNIDEVYSQLKLTGRQTWNKKTDLQHALKYISWGLNISLNIITIRRMKCPTTHLFRDQLIYLFNNPMVKLLRTCNYNSVNLLIYKKKIFSIHQKNIFPKLIDMPEQSEIRFRNVPVTSENILQIINNSLLVKFNLQINVYTSYTYLKNTSKTLGSNMIGQYNPDLGDSELKLNIFVSPTLEGDGIFIHQLDITNTYTKNSFFTNTHIQEGNKTLFPHAMETEKIHNNQHCVCAHKETQQFFAPKKYNHLGKEF